jgi:hypothetical protein
MLPQDEVSRAKKTIIAKFIFHGLRDQAEVPPRARGCTQPASRCCAGKVIKV